MSPLRLRPSLRNASLLGLFSLTTIAAHAQSSSGLQGRVTDVSGRPLRNAVVQLVSDQTAHGGHSWRYTLMGDSLGKFSQEGLAPGAYLVMLFTDGKGTNVLRNVQLKAGETQALELTLVAPTVELAGASSTDERRRITGQLH